MKIMYIVSDGEYSDYGIQSVWDTKEGARAEVDKNGGYIEEWILNETRGERICIVMDKNGAVDHLHKYGPRVEENKIFLHYTKKVELLRFYSKSTDERAAIKAANELRAQLIALDRWKEGPV